jgi:hypothetical protein
LIPHRAGGFPHRESRPKGGEGKVVRGTQEDPPPVTHAQKLLIGKLLEAPFERVHTPIDACESGTEKVCPKLTGRQERNAFRAAWGIGNPV